MTLYGATRGPGGGGASKTGAEMTLCHVVCVMQCVFKKQGLEYSLK